MLQRTPHLTLCPHRSPMFPTHTTRATRPPHLFIKISRCRRPNRSSLCLHPSPRTATVRSGNTRQALRLRPTLSLNYLPPQPRRLGLGSVHIFTPAPPMPSKGLLCRRSQDHQTTQIRTEPETARTLDTYNSTIFVSNTIRAGRRGAPWASKNVNGAKTEKWIVNAFSDEFSVDVFGRTSDVFSDNT